MKFVPTLLLSALCLACIFACRHKEKPSDPVTYSGQDYSEGEISVISLQDTLDKYAKLDTTLFDISSGGFSLVTDKLHGVRFLLINNENYDDTAAYGFWIYQMKNGQWDLVHSIAKYYPGEHGDSIEDRYAISLFRTPDFPDLNGDTFKDIRLSFTEGVRNTGHIVFLFDPVKKAFRYNPYYSGLLNLSYSPEKKRVLSFWRGSESAEKYMYIYRGDTLAMDKMVSIAYSREDTVATITYYTEKNGSLITLNDRRGIFEDIWQEFDRALWKVDWERE